MKVTEIKQKYETVTTDILCNKCTKSLKRSKYGSFCGLEENFIELKEDSIIEGEGEGSWTTFSLCEECLIDLIETFSIPIEWKK